MKGNRLYHVIGKDVFSFGTMASVYTPESLKDNTKSFSFQGSKEHLDLVLNAKHIEFGEDRLIVTKGSTINMTMELLITPLRNASHVKALLAKAKGALASKDAQDYTGLYKQLSSIKVQTPGSSLVTDAISHYYKGFLYVGNRRYIVAVPHNDPDLKFDQPIELQRDTFNNLSSVSKSIEKVIHSRTTKGPVLIVKEQNAFHISSYPDKQRKDEQIYDRVFGVLSKVRTLPVKVTFTADQYREISKEAKEVSSISIDGSTLTLLHGGIKSSKRIDLPEAVDTSVTFPIYSLFSNTAPRKGEILLRYDNQLPAVCFHYIEHPTKKKKSDPDPEPVTVRYVILSKHIGNK